MIELQNSATLINHYLFSRAFKKIYRKISIVSEYIELLILDELEIIFRLLYSLGDGEGLILFL